MKRNIAERVIYSGSSHKHFLVVPPHQDLPQQGMNNHKHTKTELKPLPQQNKYNYFLIS